MTAGPARRASAQGTLRREEIVRAALEAFASNGFYGTSMRAVALAVGISHVGLAHHFKSKEDLLTAVLEHRDEVTAAQLADSPTVQLEDVLIRLLELNQQSPTLRRLFATLSTEACDPGHPAHDYFVDRYARARERIAEILETMQAAGSVRLPGDARLTATTILAVLDGLQVQWMLDPAVDEVSAMRAFLARILH